MKCVVLVVLIMAWCTFGEGNRRRESAIDVDRNGDLRISSPGDITLQAGDGAGLVILGEKITSWAELAKRILADMPSLPTMQSNALGDTNATATIKHLQLKVNHLEKRLKTLEDRSGGTIVSSWMAPIYFQMMTPDWLRSHATFYETPLVSSQRIGFIPAEIKYHRLLSVPLLPAGQLDADKTYLISMTIHHTKLGQEQTDNDLMLAISDKTAAAGFWFMDQQPFVTLAGVPGPVLTQITRSVPDMEAPTSGAYPEIWHMRMRLTSQSSWGTVWGPSLSAGQGKQSVYPRVLRPSQGLWLELYRNDPSESYLIKYIEVTISTEH